MTNLSVPIWLFTQPRAYSTLDLLGDHICVCRSEKPSLVYAGHFAQLPELSLIHRTASPQIRALKLIHTKIGVCALVLCTDYIQLVRYDVPVIEERCLYTFLREPNLITKCIINNSLSILIVSSNNRLGSCDLKANSLSINWLGSHDEWVEHIEFLTNSRLLLSLSNDACILWNVLNEAQLCKFANHRLVPSTFAFNSSLQDTFSCGTRDGQILLIHYTLENMNSSNTFPLRKYEENSCCIQSSRAEFVKTSQPTGDGTWNKAGYLAPKVSDDLKYHILAIGDVLQCEKTISAAQHRSSQVKLFVITCTQIWLIDLVNHQLVVQWGWMDLGLSNWTYLLEAGVSVGENSLNFWLKSSRNEMAFFGLDLKSIGIKSHAAQIDQLTHSTSQLSLLAKQDLQAGSMLHKVMHRRCKSISSKPMNRGTDPMHKPITFGHPIKSSGYAKQEPKQKMFHPLTLQKKQPVKKDRGGRLESLTQTYSHIGIAPDSFGYTGMVDAHTTPIYHLAYSTTGSRLAVGLGTNVCLLFRCPNPNKLPDKMKLPVADTLRGHSGPVLSASWSSDSRLLLTSSADRTARLWSMRSMNEPQSTDLKNTLLINSIRGGSSNSYGANISQIRSNIVQNNRTCSVPNTEPFPDCLQFANFHYLDSFIYVVCQNIIRLYSYGLAEDTTILNKGRANNHYKLAGTFAIDSCNRLTAVASVNIFYSYLLLCAGSDRRLSIVDLNTEEVIRQNRVVHSRNITGIALNQGSIYSSLATMTHHNGYSQPTEYTTFATVAPGDGIRMWDLRDLDRPAIQFAVPDLISSAGAPVNPMVPPVTLAFSPCGRLLAVGGKINPQQPHPVIYDIRQPVSPPLFTLTPNGTNKTATAPATVVAWHPSRPEVATGSHDGQLTSFVNVSCT